MKYQLVLQFPAKSLSDFDRMIAIENDLTKVLGSSAEVDGHDFGSGEINIFIHTQTNQKGRWNEFSPPSQNESCLNSWWLRIGQ